LLWLGRTPLAHSQLLIGTITYSAPPLFGEFFTNMVEDIMIEKEYLQGSE